MHKPLVVVGTRPEIIKVAPIIRTLGEKKADFVFVHTGQHHDFNMSLSFIEELKLPKPSISLLTRSNVPDQQLGLLVKRIGAVIRREQPAIVLVEGDTNSVLASALAANKSGTRVGHVEAGLRSFDLRMPEEHNRRIVDHISSLLFAPTRVSKHNLEREAVWGDIHVTGNTVIDAVLHDIIRAEETSKVLEKVEFEEFALATMHRAENVDDPSVLKEFVYALNKVSTGVVLPLHPRTRRRLNQYGLWGKLSKCKSVTMLPPVGYFDFLVLLRHCKFVLTDSGGVQEEATAPGVGKRVVVLRRSTERPEAVAAGFAKVVGCHASAIIRGMAWAEESGATLPTASPFGDGHAADKIVKIILEG